MGAWKSIAKVVAYPVTHPSRTLQGMGKTTKAVVVGAGAGYVGWEKLTTDKSLTRIVGDAVIGKETCDSVGEGVSAVASLPGKAVDTIDGLTQSVDGATNSMSGIGKFVDNFKSGNILDGIGNFFGNFMGGKVSGTSLLGLLTSAFLLFGRFGWFGKIAGAVLGMMILGNNMGASQTQTQQQSQSEGQQRQQDNIQRSNTQSAQAMPQQPSVPIIHR